MDPRHEIDDEFDDVEESLEHKRDAFERTDRQMVKADLRAEAGRHQSHRPSAVEIVEDDSDSVDEDERSHERLLALEQEEVEPRDD